MGRFRGYLTRKLYCLPASVLHTKSLHYLFIPSGLFTSFLSLEIQHAMPFLIYNAFMSKDNNNERVYLCYEGAVRSRELAAEAQRAAIKARAYTGGKKRLLSKTLADLQQEFHRSDDVVLVTDPEMGEDDIELSRRASKFLADAGISSRSGTFVDLLLEIINRGKVR